ncbi:MAG: MBL fold metallo-hydrolase [Eubacteriales bacterium]|nr:MBL fold metallo-hydrolase [Eubacteriales bacterium]MDD4389480.1 MBL fold metallo-hydrolase [Eubacteriales bacterium]
MIFKCMESGMLGANTYFIADEKNKLGFIVDPGGHNNDMVNHIRESGCALEYVVLTHGHCDHIGGVDYYKQEFPTIKIVACEAEKKILFNPKLNMSPMIGENISMEADIWVRDNDKLSVGDLELKFIQTPGHTPGGMCILIDDILLSGDTLFRASIGRTDFPNGSFDELMDSIRNKLFILPDEIKVFPGHMSETTIGFEKRNNPFV